MTGQSNIGFVLNQLDNVMTLPWGGSAGESVCLRGVSCGNTKAPVLQEDIQPGHKVALSVISKGAPVVKYGLPIGIARLDVPAGAWVHVENVRSRFAPDDTSDASAETVCASIWPESLFEVVRDVLQAAGAEADVAVDAARHCTSAEERGVSTHGIRRLPALVARLRAGGIDGSALPRVESDGSIVRVDGLNGLGHHVARLATDAVIKAARSNGIAVALVRNSSHFGYAGFYATQIAKAGMVGIAISNGQVLVGPPGARKAIFSNNPLALAAPVGGSGIFEFDMATSVTSRARIAMAAEAGEAITSGVALDRNGHATTNATEALEGILLPLGGEKGFGFIAALEVLTGVLPGGAYADQVISKQASPGLAEGTSHFLMAISPAACGGEDAFRARMADLERRVTDLPMAPGYSAARLPGARRAALAKECANSGIPLGKPAVDILRNLANEFGLDLNMLPEGAP